MGGDGRSRLSPEIELIRCLSDKLMGVRGTREKEDVTVRTGNDERLDETLRREKNKYLWELLGSKIWRWPG